MDENKINKEVKKLAMALFPIPGVGTKISKKEILKGLKELYKVKECLEKQKESKN